MDNPFSEPADLHKPYQCSICGHTLRYIGLGEYECVNDKCKRIERDDYGKVRAYLELHKNAKLAVVSEQTGVSRRDIQRMLDEQRFDTPNIKKLNAD